MSAPCRPLLVCLLLSLVVMLTAGSAIAEAGDPDAAETDCQPRYTFSWPLNECSPAPRGGTTQGAKLTLASGPTDTWLALREPGLSRFERDRRAILAMAGGYRTRFEFLETQGLSPDYERAKPYQSWGTEYVYVVRDEREFISLQHIMVMFFREGGDTRGPVVMKHWRQDWRYQDTDILQYRGDHRWKTQKLSPGEVAGTWSQTVYQVDDTPRYASYGHWRHNASFSSWESQRTWRPLPRRERSVRDDYQVLEGINRHVILPRGWLHEQENLKLRLAQAGTPADPPYIAREIGLNRYQPVTGFDFSAGDAYWEETGPFWALVREQWRRIIDTHTAFRVRPEKDGRALFSVLFELAAQFRDGEVSLEQAQTQLRATLTDYLQTGS